MSRKYNKTFTSLKTVVHDTSILDAQKILVKPFNGQANERTDIIELINGIENENAINSGRLEDVEKEVLGDYIPHNFTTNSTGRSNETEGTAIQISKAHFINGGVQIQNLQLPYTGALGITDQYCHIQFCDANNEIIKVIVSKNTQSRVSGNTDVSIWDFEKDAIVPEDYHVARIVLSGIKETSEFGTTTVFRINVVNNNGVEFDNDECCIWNGAGTSYNYLGDVSLTYGIHGGTLKSQLNEEIENIEERIINIEDILSGEVIEKTFNVNTFGANLDNATITGFQYSFVHFIADCKLLSLSFPYSYTGLSVNEGYLFAEVCDADFNRLTKAYSKNTFGFGSNGSPAVFTFENLILPKEYHIIRFALVANTEKEPNFSNGNNCLSFRSRPLKIGSDVRFDDDECLIYSGSTTENWIIDASVIYEARDGGLIQKYNDDIFNLNTELSRVDSSVGTLYNEFNPQIQSLAASLADIEDILDGEFVDKTFTTATTGDTAETAGRGIQLSKTHFIEGGTILKSLSLPYKGADYTRNNQYCHVTFYNASEQPIKKITSTDTQSRAYNTNGVSKWTFTENNTLPDDYYYAQIALSGSAADNPNIKTGSQCSTYTINVIRKNGNNVEFDDDICQCYNESGAVMNYLGDVTVEYQGPGPTLAEIIADNSNRISNLEENGTSNEGIGQLQTDVSELQTDVSELQSKNYAYTDEANVFTTTNTFNGGMISNGDIILNGSRLLLANGAAVELYTGEELPTPEGSGESNPLPNTGSCSYNEVKEHVEYHLQDNWSHLSFTERIVMDSIYRADIDNHISYYNSNRIDKVSSLQYTTANKIVLHTPYFLNGTLSVIQLTRDTTAAVNCKLIASFYDKDDNLLISKVSINSWDYSQTGSVANFFFNAFDVPYNSTKLILEFTTDGSTPINDFIPIGYIVDSTTNGDTIVSPSGVMNYRVYITQFTPSPAITGLVPDTENILLDLAYGNMANSGTNADVGNITLAGTSTIVSPVSVTPISESGWLFGIVKFNEATSDAYIALNGIEIYRGDSLIGTSPFPLSLLLSPGDTFEASEKTQIENLRVYGCK